MTFPCVQLKVSKSLNIFILILNLFKYLLEKKSKIKPTNKQIRDGESQWLAHLKIFFSHQIAVSYFLKLQRFRKMFFSIITITVNLPLNLFCCEIQFLLHHKSLHHFRRAVAINFRQVGGNYETIWVNAN